MSTSKWLEKPSIAPNDSIPSSSPAFGTPAHPINPRRTALIPAPPALRPAVKSTVLPILLPPATLRPLAFRTFTKKYNLTLSSSALHALATFIGKQCGSGWREEGLAEKVLEEIAKTWKKCGGQVIVDGDNDTLKSILKTLEGAMTGGRIVQGSSLSRQSSFAFGTDTHGLMSRPSLESQSSFGISSLEVEDRDDEEDLLKDPREWIKVIGAFEQPKMTYNVTQRHFAKSTLKSSLFPDPSHRTDLFRQRFHIVHQRILRHESFQGYSSTAQAGNARQGGPNALSSKSTITPIANLLGRAGSTHLLLGMLTVSTTGALSLSDLTGTITLSLQHAQPIPENGVYFTPGMIVLIEGTYEEDAGEVSTLGGGSGIGGTIGGKFLGFTIGHPPCERRTATLGGAENDDKGSLASPVFGWTDFLGVGSQRATSSRMNKIAAKLLDADSAHNIVIASDLHLDTQSTLSALRTLLRTYSPDRPGSQHTYPLAIILIGNFSSKASLAGVPGAGSIEYKEHFDALASMIADFQLLIAHTTLIFVPGDNDAWPSALAAGAATPLPRKSVPPVFTNRIRRVVAEANREVWGAGKTKGKEGEVVWTSNPSRLSWFGVKGEMVILRDDTMSRLQRTSIRFNKPEPDVEDDMPFAPSHQQNLLSTGDAMDMDLNVSQGRQSGPGIATTNDAEIDPDTLTARALTRTILSQAHLSPFPISRRPLLWDYAHVLSLYPLPTCLVLADADAPAFVVKYFGCTVMSPGRLDESGGGGRKEGKAKWLEYDIRSGVGAMKTAE